jgi:hypothetical protein
MSSSNERTSSIDDVRRLMEQVVIAYGALVDEAGQNLPILSSEHQVTATDAARAASALLSAVNLEVFELAMWQEFGGRPTAMRQVSGDSPEQKVNGNHG